MNRTREQGLLILVGLYFVFELSTWANLKAPVPQKKSSVSSIQIQRNQAGEVHHPVDLLHAVSQSNQVSKDSHLPSSSQGSGSLSSSESRKMDFEKVRSECEKKMQNFLEQEVATRTLKQSSEAKRIIVKSLLKENKKGEIDLSSPQLKGGAHSSHFLCEGNISLRDLILLRNAVAIRELSTSQGWLGSFYQKQIHVLREARGCAFQILEHYPVSENKVFAEKSYLRIKAEVLRVLRAQGFNPENLEVSDRLDEMMKKMGSVTDIHDESEEGRGEDVVLVTRGVPSGALDDSQIDVSRYFSADGCTSKEMISEVDTVETLTEVLGGIGSVQSQRRSVNNRGEVFRQPERKEHIGGSSKQGAVIESDGERAR